MIKYAQIIDEEKNIVSVGIGTDTDYYESIGMTEMDVEQGDDGQWYVKGYAPQRPLEELKDWKLAEIDAWTAAKITSGFTSECSGELVRYDSDKDTQLTMQGIALNVNTDRFAVEYPTGCPVRGYADGSTDKTIFYLTPEQVLEWCADLSTHIGTCKQAGWNKQAEVNAAQSKEELDAIILD